MKSKFFIVTAVTLLLLCPVYVVFAEIKADGIASPGEYQQEASFSDGRGILFWTFTDTALFAAVQVRTAGWVSVGFDPEEVMSGADMVIGWVDPDGTAHVEDCYATGPFGPHPTDGDLGGADQLLSRGAAEKDGVTTVEFSRPLKAGDEFDKDVSPGVSVIWAYAESDDFNAAHSEAGHTIFSASGSTEPQSSDTAGKLSRAAGNRYLGLILPHAIALSLAFIGMLTGMLIARYGKKNKNWLKIHRPLGYVSASLAVIGLVMGIRLVVSTSGMHFRVPHAFMAIVTLLTVFAAPVLGRGMTAWKKSAKIVRKVHRIVGRIAILLMALTIVSGLLQVFRPF